jgi:hypothetical protein
MVIVDLRVVTIADDTEGAEWHRHLVGIRIDKGGFTVGPARTATCRGVQGPSRGVVIGRPNVTQW